jgi:hypothetical protein
VSAEAKDLIYRFLSPPKERLGYNGVGSIKSHPWFTPINWASLQSMAPPFEVSVEETVCVSFSHASFVSRVWKTSSIADTLRALPPRASRRCAWTTPRTWCHPMTTRGRSPTPTGTGLTNPKHFLSLEMGLLVLVLVAVVCVAEARPRAVSMRHFPGAGRSVASRKRSPATPTPVVEMYTQILDHFNQVRVVSPRLCRASFSQTAFSLGSNAGDISAAHPQVRRLLGQEQHQVELCIVPRTRFLLHGKRESCHRLLLQQRLHV